MIHLQQRWERMRKMLPRVINFNFLFQSLTRDITWHLIACSDESWLNYQFSLHHSYICSWIVRRICIMTLQVTCIFIALCSVPHYHQPSSSPRRWLSGRCRGQWGDRQCLSVWTFLHRLCKVCPVVSDVRSWSLLFVCLFVCLLLWMCLTADKLLVKPDSYSSNILYLISKLSNLVIILLDIF